MFHSLTSSLWLCMWVSPFVCASLFIPFCLSVCLSVFLDLPLSLLCSLTCIAKLQCCHLQSTVSCTFYADATIVTQTNTETRRITETTCTDEPSTTTTSILVTGTYKSIKYNLGYSKIYWMHAKYQYSTLVYWYTVILTCVLYLVLFKRSLQRNKMENIIYVIKGSNYIVYKCILHTFVCRCFNSNSDYDSDTYRNTHSDRFNMYR